MKYMRLTAIALLALLTVAGCGNKEEPANTSSSNSSNELLSYVPADTPYLAANLEPVPEEVLDAFLERLQPVLDTMQSRLTSARGELEAQQDNPDARLAHALLMEFDGKLSRQGLESMGFDLRSKRVLYGMGAFPVVRLSLSDAQALRDTVLRVMDNAQITAAEQELQGVSYWRLSDEGASGVSAGLYISIFDDHLALALFPTMAEAELLPAFLGLELPTGSNAQARLETLNKAQGYTGYGSGILDVQKFADQFLTPDTPAGKAMAASGEFDPATISPECVAEIHEIIAHTPRMTVGVKELSKSSFAAQYRLETPETLAGQLMGLVSKIPAADKLSNRILELSFGMRFGPVRDFLLEKATAIVNDPYQCERLAQLNENAAESLAQLNQPMPPFLNNFQGVRVSLSEFKPIQDAMPENTRGQMAVHVEQPQMFIGMAQMFLPDLSSLTIKPGEPPVRLPENLIPVPGLVAFAAMSDDAIGLALGEGEEDGLTAFLDRKAGPEGMFLSASYDMAAYLEYSEKLGEYQPDLSDTDGEGHTSHAEAARELQEAMSIALKKMADRSDSSMSFTPGGLVIDSRTTFK
ncbi:hypothetical protein ACFL00_04915 [Pseudomonadota bacterium]